MPILKGAYYSPRTETKLNTDNQVNADIKYRAAVTSHYVGASAKFYAVLVSSYVAMQ